MYDKRNWLLFQYVSKMLDRNILLVLIALAGLAHGQSQDPLSRDMDPVILKGTDVPNYYGAAVTDITGYSWDQTRGEFTQVPVQIDEMHMQDYDVIKKGDCL